MIGIYGANGSGKSTLLDLIFGFTKANKGQIFIDNIKITDSLNEWQTKISYVPQKIYLVDTSILENIIFKNKIEPLEKSILNSALEKSDSTVF